MPTGHTVAILEEDFNFKNWLKTNLIRQFGVCVQFRDYDGGLDNPEDLTKAFTSNLQRVTSDRKKTLKESKKKLNYFENLKKDDWEKLYKNFIKEETDGAIKRQKEFDKNKKKHQEVLNQIEKMQNSDIAKTNEILINVLELAQEQVKKTMDFDYDIEYAPINFIPKFSFNEWKDIQLNGAKENVKSNEEYLKKEVERVTDRHKTYLEYINIIDKFFKEEGDTNERKLS